MNIFFILLGVLLSLVFGSFFNVIIYRVPKKISVIYPPSHCPLCLYKIKWYENLPIAGWIFLKGRCTSCHEKISLQYILIELSSAILFLVSYMEYGFHAKTVSLTVFLWLCMILLMIDAQTGLLPDRVTKPGIAVGIAINGAIAAWYAITHNDIHKTFLFSLHQHQIISGYSTTVWHNVSSIGLVSPISSVSGAAIGYLGLLLFSWLFFLWKRKMGLGGGDLKMFAMIGAWLGIESLYPVLFMAALLALMAQPVFFLLKRIQWLRKDGIYGAGVLVFGPYLAIAAGLFAVFPVIGSWLLG